MELTNSKRLLYTASYVTTHLTPDEQHRLEAQPGRGYQKANLLRGLGLRAQDLGAIRERITALPANAQQRQLRKLLTTAETLATNERGVSTMALAAAMAPIPEDTILHFAKFAPGYKDGTVVSVIVGALRAPAPHSSHRTPTSRTDRDVPRRRAKGRACVHRANGSRRDSYDLPQGVVHFLPRIRGDRARLFRELQRARGGRENRRVNVYRERIEALERPQLWCDAQRRVRRSDADHNPRPIEHQRGTGIR